MSPIAQLLLSIVPALLYVLVIGFVLVCLARLVKAVERIADKLDKP